MRLYNFTKPKGGSGAGGCSEGSRAAESDRGQQMVLALSGSSTLKAQIRRVHDWRKRHSTAAFLLHGAQEVRKGLWFLLRRLEKKLGRGRDKQKTGSLLRSLRTGDLGYAVGSLSSEHGTGVEIAAQPESSSIGWLARRLAADSKV